MGQDLWQVLPEVPHLILSSPETGAILIPLLQVSQLRLREVKSLPRSGAHSGGAGPEARAGLCT